ncbi:MAG TPA: hypothetical protein VMV77_08990 [Bacteroidales bacterium]|nr:hypothetical protein [Bacteroidales bacterium]
MTKEEKTINDSRIKAESRLIEAAQAELNEWDSAYENTFYRKGYTVKQVRQIKRRLERNAKGVF